MRYADYSAEIDAVALQRSVYTESAGAGVRRVFYVIYRLPAEKRFVVRLFHDANAEDRANIETAIATSRIGRIFSGAEALGTTRRNRRDNGTYAIRARFGRILEDPLMQVELEMMIDLSSEVTV